MGLTVARAAGPWYVAPGGNDGNLCDSPTAPCATINGAIGKATGGDTIYVAMGSYTYYDPNPYPPPGGNVVSINKDIILSGGWDVAFTAQNGISTIDGEDARRGIYVDSGVTANVDHFTIQHGYTYVDTYDGNGGGIYNSGSLTLINSSVSHNTASGGGGGIYASGGSSTAIMDSRIYANTADDSQGGGITLRSGSDLSMSRSWVVGNSAIHQDAGGISIANDSSTYIENSIIAGNYTPGSGGGLWLEQGESHYLIIYIINSHIVGNQANEDGAAIAGWHAQVGITNTLFISNMGITGIGSQGDTSAVFLLSHCDTYGNSPDDTVNVTITRTNCLGEPPEDGLDPLMAGGALPGGVGPDFADDWLSYDYRLLPGSPAIGAGTATGAPATDIDGNPRDATPDMGAYEYLYPKYIYLPLISR